MPAPRPPRRPPTVSMDRPCRHDRPRLGIFQRTCIVPATLYARRRRAAPLHLSLSIGCYAPEIMPVFKRGIVRVKGRSDCRKTRIRYIMENFSRAQCGRPRASPRWPPARSFAVGTPCTMLWHRRHGSRHESLAAGAPRGHCSAPRRPPAGTTREPGVRGAPSRRLRGVCRSRAGLCAPARRHPAGENLDSSPGSLVR